tara:strand:- start:1105 stop:1281 length:177 start_codon:yes stop_codon:yes gene_type:complete
MKVGDLVKHKRLGTLGVIINILDALDGDSANDIYNVKWIDDLNHGLYCSHWLREFKGV